MSWAGFRKHKEPEPSAASNQPSSRLAITDNIVIFGQDKDTRIPPDVRPTTHVIGVLGCADLNKDWASPEADGWFVSDFYLWKNVLAGMGKSQRWFTCEDPARLLDKYCSRRHPSTGASRQWLDGYVHGDQYEERTVVLDGEHLPQATQNLEITPSGRPLQDAFLKYLRTTASHAAKNGDHVLILIFSHGDDDPNAVGGLLVGLDPREQDIHRYITRDKIADAVNGAQNLKFSMFLTSCYSGYWVSNPLITVEKRPAIITAAREFEMSFAHTRSASQRHGGGLFSSACLNAILQDPDPQAEDANLPLSLPETAESVQQQTYGQFIARTTAEMERLCGDSWVALGEGSRPQFDPHGHDEILQHRTGYPLAAYRANYARLKKIPKSDPNPSFDKKYPFGDESRDDEFRAWKIRHPELEGIESQVATGGYGTTAKGRQSSIRYLATYYARSRPGSSDHTPNIWLHKNLDAYNAGRLELNGQITLRAELAYRVAAMSKANLYVKLLGFTNVPTCEAFDHHLWTQDSKLREQQIKNQAIISQRRIFAPGPGRTAMRFSKPEQYLAATFVMKRQKVEEGLEYLEKNLKPAAIEWAEKIRTSSASIGASLGELSTIRKRSLNQRALSPRGHKQWKSIEDYPWARLGEGS